MPAKSQHDKAKSRGVDQTFYEMCRCLGSRLQDEYQEATRLKFSWYQGYQAALRGLENLPSALADALASGDVESIDELLGISAATAEGLRIMLEGLRFVNPDSLIDYDEPDLHIDPYENETDEEAEIRQEVADILFEDDDKVIVSVQPAGQEKGVDQPPGYTVVIVHTP